MVSSVNICAYSCTPLHFGLYLVVSPPKTRPECGESYPHFVKKNVQLPAEALANFPILQNLCSL